MLGPGSTNYMKDENWVEMTEGLNDRGEKAGHLALKPLLVRIMRNCLTNYTYARFQ